MRLSTSQLSFMNFNVLLGLLTITKLSEVAYKVTIAIYLKLLLMIVFIFRSNHIKIAYILPNIRVKNIMAYQF